MLETSEFLGSHRYDEPEDLAARVGKCDPPIGVSLFSGAGGFDLGFAQAGYDVRVMVESNQECADVLRLNEEYFDDHTKPVIFERDIQDVATFEILEAAGVGVGGVSVVYGGPPCQGFSHIGKRVDMMAMPEEGNPQFHMAAKPGTIEHPEFFRDRHDLNAPDQVTFDAFGDDPETLDEYIEQIIQDGAADLGGDRGDV